MSDIQKSLPIKQLERIDSKCLQFEAILKSGATPNIPDFLSDSIGDERTALIAELVQLDIEYKRRRGEAVDPDRYRELFPDLDSRIFSQASSSDTIFDEPTGSLSADTSNDGFAKSAIAPEQHDLNPGTIVGHYLIGEVIGRGGMGVVYAAEHQHLKRRVALKLQPKGSATDRRKLEQFRLELELIASLSHPNVVTAFDAGEFNRRLYLVTELVDGCDLAQEIRSNGPMNFDDALNCIRETALALSYAHREGVIHRDVKPSNLLRDRAGTIKVTDLGLAQFKPSKGFEKTKTACTEDSFVAMGTIDFMSPEQARDSSTADARSDIYSLGCTLHYLLTGRPVFEGATALDRIVAHASNPIPDFSFDDSSPDNSTSENGTTKNGTTKNSTTKNSTTKNSTTKNSTTKNSTTKNGAEKRARCEEIFKRMVAKSPDDRFATMDEVIAAVDHCFAAAPVAPSETPSETLFTAPSEHAGLSRRETHSSNRNQRQHSTTKKLAISLLALIAVAAVCAGLFLWLNNSQRIESQTDSSARTSLPIPEIPFDNPSELQSQWARHLDVPKRITERGIDFVLIPAGKFQMGTSPQQIEHLQRYRMIEAADSKRETPQETKTIAAPFYFATQEITVAQFRDFVNATKYVTKIERDRTSQLGGRPPCVGFGLIDGNWETGPQFDWSNAGELNLHDDLPVMNVSHSDAEAFVQWLSESDGEHHYRLPFQEEWEFAARAGTDTLWYFSSTRGAVSEHSWNVSNSNNVPHPVGEKLANPFGLFDIYGNLEEWCADRFSEHSNNSERWTDNSVRPPNHFNRVVLRGGHFMGRAEHRSSSRSYTARQSVGARGIRVLREMAVE